MKGKRLQGCFYKDTTFTISTATEMCIVLIANLDSLIVSCSS